MENEAQMDFFNKAIDLVHIIRVHNDNQHKALLEPNKETVAAQRVSEIQLLTAQAHLLTSAERLGL